MSRMRQEDEQEEMMIEQGEPAEPPQQPHGATPESTQELTLQEIQEMELPETQNMDEEAQQEEARVLQEMAHQQEEAQEEQQTLQALQEIMAQQRAEAQNEVRLERRWRQASMEKIRRAASEMSEGYMQHLKGDTAMHKLSNEYWKKNKECDTRQ
ncbi:hypothetical protein CYMTET_12770 [Cymbomonas tetramitiformis]|uniref:Uncharacterized protein n=1 Tax=Cymbomonas tetramitiformis TaxID=36881 RepID=A0AAE0GJT0_9CHLO|nr:hypothetical protein CYMTET_12770 [Cymbomonas tetramitiformis]